MARNVGHFLPQGLYGCSEHEVLVISLGANGSDKHEVSANLIHSMDLIVTDDIATAQSGSGDLIAAC